MVWITRQRTKLRSLDCIRGTSVVRCSFEIVSKQLVARILTSSSVLLHV